MAKRIVRHFAIETLEVIEQAPQRLIEVPGIGIKRQQMIVGAWTEQKAIKEVMLFLQSHGVTSSLATKIYKYYGDEAIGIVRSDPYRLARDIYGIGFLTADKIARALGHPLRFTGARRRRAALCAQRSQRRRACLFAQQRTGQDGHRNVGGDAGADRRPGLCNFGAATKSRSPLMPEG